MVLSINFVPFFWLGPPGGGRNKVTQRFIRHLHCISINEFDDETNKLIFRQLLDWHFEAKGFDSSFKALSSSVVNATSVVYNNAIQNLLPTPTKSHYLFNLRDFARVIAGKSVLIKWHVRWHCLH